MADFGNHNNNTDWDLSAFISRRQTSFKSPASASGMLPRPKGLPNQSEQNFGQDTPNGMDFFNTPPSNQAVDIEEERFCTRTNLDSRLRYLNQEFIALGFSTLFPKTVIAGRETEAKFDLTHLVNGTYELLKTHVRHVKARDDLEAKHVRSESDNDMLFQSQARLKEELEQSKREICVVQMREKKLNEQCKMFQQERKVEREEMKKMKSEMQHKQKQFNHESKRREKEMHKLKERVHQLLTDKNQERRMGMEILNAIQRPDGKRKMWNTGVKREEEMYRLIISNYEERHKELITEINLLREYLADVQKELVSLLNERTNQSGDENEENYEEDQKQEFENGRFHMPFNLVGEDMKNSFRNTWQQLKDKLEQNSSKASSPIDTETQLSDASSEVTADLKRQIENYRAIITKQEQLLQSMQDDKMMKKIETYLQGDVSFTVQEQEKSTKEERRKLLEERKMTTEFACKLAQEREAFEKERMEFYNHCISTPVIQKELGEKAHSNSRLKYQRSTPVFSPAPRSTGKSSGKSGSVKTIKTPSTADIYRYMSLAVNDDGDEGDSQDPYGQNNPETPLRKESYLSDHSTDSGKGSFRTQRVAEHAENVRRVLETMPKRSLEEIVAI